MGDNIFDDNFRDTIIYLLLKNVRLKLSQDVTINHVKEKGKPRCKLSYKVFELKYGYYSLLEIYMFQTFILLKDFLGEIQHYVTVFVMWIFDRIIPFALLLAHYKLDYCCTNDDETK